MNDLELALRLAAYLLSSLSLLLAAWAVVDRTLPRSSRLGLRLLAALSLFFVFTATLVQLLGLAGWLREPAYLGISLLPGMAAAAAQRTRHSFGRLPLLTFRQLIVAPGWGIGGLTAFLLVYFSLRFFKLPYDVDALTIHGPLVAEWVQAGRVTFFSEWNYPQCWEYQFVPGFLLLRSDAVAIVPGFLGAFCLFLALRELAAGLGAGGRLAYLASLLWVASPVLWRDPLKADAIFALGQLLALLAIERAARGSRGSFWLLQPAIFLMLGTKASGYFYTAIFLSLYLLVTWLRAPRGWLRCGRRRSGLPLAGAFAFTLIFNASAALVQIRNWVVYGSPVYPVRWQIGKVVLLDGPVDVAGTSILDYAAQLDTWREVLAGGRFAAGIEWPFLLLALTAASLHAGVASCRERRRHHFAWLAAALLAWLLWAVFVANPWSYSRIPNPTAVGQTSLIGGGHSLRFAIAPLGLTYLVAAVAARRWLPRLPAWLPIAGCLLLVYLKWRGILWQPSWPPFGQTLAAFLLALLGLAGEKKLAERQPATRLKQVIALSLAAAAVLLLATLYLRQIEVERRSAWLPRYREVWTFVWDQIPAGSSIAINHPFATNRYPLYGPRFENKLVVLPAGDPANIPPDVDYLYYFVGNRRAELAPVVEALRQQGWRQAAAPADGRGALFERLGDEAMLPAALLLNPGKAN